MEPDLQLLSENSSLLLEGTDPDEDTTKSFEANLADEKRYQDTLESARTMSDMLKLGVCVSVCYQILFHTLILFHTQRVVVRYRK